MEKGLPRVCAILGIIGLIIVIFAIVRGTILRFDALWLVGYMFYVFFFTLIVCQREEVKLFRIIKKLNPSIDESLRRKE